MRNKRGPRERANLTNTLLTKKDLGFVCDMISDNYARAIIIRLLQALRSPVGCRHVVFRQ